MRLPASPAEGLRLREKQEEGDWEVFFSHLFLRICKGFQTRTHARLIYILTPKEARSENACWVIEMMVFGSFQHPARSHSATDNGLPDEWRSRKHLLKLPQGLQKAL